MLQELRRQPSPQLDPRQVLRQRRPLQARAAHAQPTKILRYWELTGLMQAYDEINLAEAMNDLQRLFPKLDVSVAGQQAEVSRHSL